MQARDALAGSATIVVVDDHPLFRGALRLALEEHFSGGERPDIVEAANLDDAQERLSETEDVDLVLLDLTMPGVSGFSGLVGLRAKYPTVPVIVVSAREDSATIRRSLELGASGFVPKSSDMNTIREAVDQVLQGMIWSPNDVELGSENDPDVADLLARMRSLTPQQTRVLTMLGEGLLNKQIAYDLSVSEATVKAHVSAILHKLNVDSRTQAAIRLSRIGPEILEPID
ncbi:MAG: response regulator transcription factor [Pseudomonadota bacterium]